MLKQRVREILLSTIDEMNSRLPEEGRIARSCDGVLFGEEGQLDSLTTANFLVAADEELSQALGVEVSLAEAFLFDDGSPPQTLEGLSEFVAAHYAHTTIAETS